MDFADDWKIVPTEKEQYQSIIANWTNQIDFTIDWTRHAESCSNFDLGNYLDQEKSSIPNIPTTTTLKAAWRYQPNLSFIGMQQAIQLGNNEPVQTTHYDDVFVSPTVRTIMTALMALRGKPYTIHVIPFITEHKNLAGEGDFQNNPVNALKLRRIVAYIKDWLEINWIKYFDDIMVIKYLSDLKNYLDNNDLDATLINTILMCKQNIDNKTYENRPYLAYGLYKEQYLPAAKQAYCTSQRKTTQSDVCYDLWYKDCIDNIVQNINALKNLLTKYIQDDNNHQQYLDPYIVFLDNIVDPSFIRGPAVDFSYWENVDLTPSHEAQHLTFNRFYTHFLPKYIQNNNNISLKKSYHFLCVSHGSILREYFRLNMSNTNTPKIMYNTQIFRESLSIDRAENELILSNRKIKYDEYIPALIRTNPEFQHLQNQNIDVCRSEGLKGMINYPLWDQSLQRGFIPATTISMASPASSWVTPDNKFLFGDNPELPADSVYYKTQYQSVVKGGNDDKYKSKYEKYKSKYLRLKKFA